MNKTLPRNVRAFSLVEVALALGIAAFCLVAIFGLLPVGLNTNQASVEQATAANVASAVMLDLQAMPKGSDPTTIQSALYKIPAPANPGGASAVQSFYVREDGMATGNPGADANASTNPHYRITVTFNVPASSQIHAAVPVRVLVTWPAMADPTASVLPTKYSGAVEFTASLLRE